MERVIVLMMKKNLVTSRLKEQRMIVLDWQAWNDNGCSLYDKEHACELLPMKNSSEEPNQ